ncbi:MAG: MBL fold metallo-hydrolase [Ponticaulis sp.]|nr:MBL fold metallo-hydrolase [Ponticaulis sp.]|tara:strand:+ start:2159 stop:2857 length:699 start_codon:yes stop_codon:yes gene_type:complete
MTEAAQPDLQLHITPVTPFQQNCSLLWDRNTMDGVFVDPGGDAGKLMEVANKASVTIKEIWLTHGHLDHAGAADEIREITGAPVIGPHKDDQWLMDDIVSQWKKYGINEGPRNVVPTRYLEDGDKLTLGRHEFEVYHTPGHTPGHVCLFNREYRLAFVGDVLFQGSVGRTDFPKGNFEQLVTSITTKLWPLGNDVTFIPGHNQPSTFGHERQTNGFVSDAAVAELKRRGQIA